MKSLRDIPAGAAAVVSALALLASVVAGREPPPAEPAHPSVRAPAPAVPDFDLEKLARARSGRPPEDLFPVPSPPAPPVAALPVAAQAQAPVAPPLPYSYLGRMQKGGQTIVYLLKNDELLIAEPGAALSPDYRVRAVSESSVEIVYLPLDTVQVLRIPDTK